MRLHYLLPDYETKLSLQTASTLTFAVFLLSLHPGVLQRLRSEILEIVGPTERPTYEHIREMKYLRAVLNGRSPSLVNEDSSSNFL